MTSTILSVYDTGNTLGEIATYVLVILMAVIWIWVMFKYLDTSELND